MFLKLHCTTYLRTGGIWVRLKFPVVVSNTPTLIVPLCSISYSAKCPISSDIGWLDEQPFRIVGGVYNIHALRMRERG